MDEPPETQKEIAGRYQDRVGYKNTRTPYRRTRFWISLTLFAAGVFAIYYVDKKSPPEFFNVGPLSTSHRNLEQGCASCHVPEPLADGQAGPPPFFRVLDQRLKNGAPSFARIDQACESCHAQHDFHEPNVIKNRSCSACHIEHHGSNGMHLVASSECAACHNQRPLMEASARLGKQLPPSQFHLNPKVTRMSEGRPNILELPRPRDGYTVSFASFSDGHPDFQLQREKVRDSDVLRFNHQRHLSGADIPPTKSGAKLDCSDCHKADPSGRFMQRISFEANCQQCHSPQFDVRNPDLQLPHGNAQLVRTFLRTLPAQYAELGRRQHGLTSERQINEFAAKQVRELLAQFPNAEELERSVFFTGDPYKSAQQADAAQQAKYTGCAFCHEVKQAAGTTYPTAEVTNPVMVDRWLPRSHFSHAAHESVASCRDCHSNAASSRLTSDVLIPAKESCVRCHNPTGLAKNASSCTTCHTYHAPEPANASVAATRTSLSLKGMSVPK